MAIVSGNSSKISLNTKQDRYELYKRCVKSFDSGRPEEVLNIIRGAFGVASERASRALTEQTTAEEIAFLYLFSDTNSEKGDYGTRYKVAYVTLLCYTRCNNEKAFSKILQGLLLATLNSPYTRGPEEFYDILNYQDQQGNSLLHHTVVHNCKWVTDVLISEGADFTVQNLQRKTPLMLGQSVEQRESLVKKAKKRALSYRGDAKSQAGYCGVLVGVTATIIVVSVCATIACYIAAFLPVITVIAIAAGYLAYYFSPDLKKANAIDKAIESAEKEYGKVKVTETLLENNIEKKAMQSTECKTKWCCK